MLQTQGRILFSYHSLVPPKMFGPPDFVCPPKLKLIGWLNENEIGPAWGCWASMNKVNFEFYKSFLTIHRCLIYRSINLRFFFFNLFWNSFFNFLFLFLFLFLWLWLLRLLFAAFLFSSDLIPIFRSFILLLYNSQKRDFLPPARILSSIKCFGTPCIPKIFRSTESLPARAFGTLNIIIELLASCYFVIFSLWTWFLCPTIELAVENFFLQLVQVKCLAFWCWCRTISSGNTLSQ